MFLRNRVGRISPLSLSDGLLVLEAVLWLGVAWVIRRLVPFGVWITRLGTLGLETVESPWPPQTNQKVVAVRDALYRATQLVPGFNQCLVKAIAVKLMLRRRRIASTLYLSVRTTAKGAPFYIFSHAWVRCGDVLMIGKGRNLVNILAVGDQFK